MFPNAEQDVLTCRSFSYEVELGFHDHEQGIKQKVSVDLEVTLKQQTDAWIRDDIKNILFNYHEAHLVMAELLGSKRFNLIETLAEEIAQVMLKMFPIRAIQVSVTKFPQDTPDLSSVTFTCLRGSQN